MAGQQVPVVGLVETERVLHDLGDVAELVADEAITVGDRAVDVDLLHRERSVGVEARPGFGRRGDGLSGKPGGVEFVRDVVEGERGHE